MKKRVTILTLWFQLIAAGICISLNMPTSGFVRFSSLFSSPEILPSKIQGWPFVFSYVEPNSFLSKFVWLAFALNILFIILLMLLVRYANEGRIATKDENVERTGNTKLRQSMSKRSILILLWIIIAILVHRSTFTNYVQVADEVNFPENEYETEDFYAKWPVMGLEFGRLNKTILVMPTSSYKRLVESVHGDAELRPHFQLSGEAKRFLVYDPFWGA